MVVVNLYPFQQTVANPDVTEDDALKISILVVQLCYVLQPKF